MICVTLAETTVEACRSLLNDLTFAEIRLDAMKVTADDVRALFSGHDNLVATCRPGVKSDDERRSLLLAAVEAGASFVDVEVESAPSLREEIIGKARSKGCKVIVSYHNYEETPEREELLRIASRCFDMGADIAKISCMAKSARDNARLLGLLDSARPVVVIGMGKTGSVTRVLAPLLGSPFTYAAYAPGKEVVEGQLDRHTVKRCIEQFALSGIISRPVEEEERER